MNTAADSSATTPIFRLQGKYGGMIVSWILGLGSVISWNSMNTVEDYYSVVFPQYHASRVITLVYRPFALILSAVFAYNESKIRTRQRNITGYSLFFLSTLSLLLLDIATSGKGGIGNFIGVCIIVGVFGVADAHVQGGMVGDLSLMCPEFLQCFLAGVAASGVLTSAVRLSTKAAFENSGSSGLRKGAVLFLGISTFIELMCILLYAFIFPKLPIVKYYRSKAASEGSKTVFADLAAAGISADHNMEHIDRFSNKQLFRQNYDHALAIFLVYVLTLSIFPGFIYENTGKHQLGSWYPLVLVAMYNVWDLISIYVPSFEMFKLENRKGLMIATLSRVLFVPAFYFTAKYAGQAWMIILVSLLGFSNGYLTVCILTIAPKGYTGPEQNALGNLLTMYLSGGLFVGAALDWLWLIGNENF